MAGTIHIMLADDHEVVRQGLRALLVAEPSFSVVGEASDGLQAAELVERLKPDVLVLDLMMPGLDGLEVARRVAKSSPKTRIVMLSMHASEAYMLEALRHGATAYVAKDASAGDLIRAIHEAAAGRRYLSPPLPEEILSAKRWETEEPVLDPYEKLSPREREVFQFAAEGLTSAQIAGRLGISPRTAETHRANILRKLGLRGQTELVRFALQRGIIPLDSGPRPARRPRARQAHD